MEVVYRDKNSIPKFSEMDTRDLPAQRDPDTIRWRDVLFDYSQASTIIGLSHITGDTPFKARRIIWTLLVITGCCIFALQVVQSVLMYYSWPVTVNVKVNYNETLVFPAVTVCNQNSFRITQSVQHGYYDLLTKAFGSFHHDDEDVEDDQAHHDVEGDKDAALHKLFEKISMADVYNQTSHTIEDMVISCQWDGRPCGHEDIVSSITDHGACMTFNGGTKADIKKVKRIGSNGGLRLRLNIEQYEYMSGPTAGAGIKLLLHDQKEIPTVRFLGQAIPPGAHALVGLSVLQVGNLKPPHGICNDDKKLEYYDHYSMSACLLDCRQRFLIQQCQCRDVYMRPGKHNETVPICTLNQYLTCLVKNLESDDASAEECGCPVPCRQTLFSPTITYATLSHFDQQKILLSNENLRKKLDKKHHQAREVRHRVDTDILQDDAARLQRFLAATTKLEATLERLKNMATNMTTKLNSMFDTWKTNYNFHRWGALYFMEYTIKHNYVRMWEIKDERTFRYITFNYKEFMSNIEFNFHELKRTANMTSPEVLAYRYAIGWGIKKALGLRVAVTSRGVDNITGVYNAFRANEADKHILYRYTSEQRYDAIYHPQCLKSYESIYENNKLIFDFISMRLDRMITTLYGYMSVSDEASKGHLIDDVKLANLNNDFIKLSKGINYDLFRYKDRIVEFSLQETEALISRFELLTTKLEELKTQVNAEIKSIDTSIEKFLETDWKYLMQAKAISSQYLRDKSIEKSQLAEVILSENIQMSMAALRKVVLDVRARSRSIKDINRALKQAVFTVYYNIMTNTTGDSCTNTLYEYLRNDTDRIKEDRSLLKAKGVARLFHSLLEPLHIQGQHLSGAEIKAMSADNLARITNADLPTLEEKEAELERLFSSFDNEFDFNKAIDTTDVNFTTILQDLRVVLKEYETTGNIDARFLRDNILNVDVFLRELSYEEIQQQKAYELTNLWSDIGGSLGLFVGATVLTVAELIDVVVHTLLRKHMMTSSGKNT
ncbi:uncharacterized protein LOC135487905 [Lineus longissimus]|uniref:uncharacterized protein LOC135487905 n=1 Tax=Lineus longissimus TaxID=88925 RepID=UPI002B4F0C6D